MKDAQLEDVLDLLRDIVDEGHITIPNFTPSTMEEALNYAYRNGWNDALNFAKDITDKIKTQMHDLQFRPLTDFDRECIVSAKDFIEDLENGAITMYDGNGYWATSTLVSTVSCFSKMPNWATHVCWYNK